MLTDFSNAATYAAEFSAALCNKLKANLLLYNAYYNHATMPAYSTGLLAYEEFALLKNGSNLKLEKLATYLAHSFPEVSEQAIGYQCCEGPIGKNIAIALEENNVELIVIGASKGSAMSHLFFGCDSMSVIDHSNRPVLVISPIAADQPIKKVTLSIDFGLGDINAIEYLLKLRKVLGFELDVVHVAVWGESACPQKEEAFKHYLSSIANTGIAYHKIVGRDAIKRVYRFCRENGSDMLAIVHREHGFFSKTFKSCNTEEALLDQNIALMVFPAQWQD